MHRAFVLLGSNIDPERHLPVAIARLRPHGLEAVSAVYETLPIGTADSRVFLNAVALLLTRGSAEAVKAICRAIEADLGRTRDPHDRFAARTIDLDLVLWDEKVGEVCGSPLPDPDITRYLHAAVPLADLSPIWSCPAMGARLPRSYAS